MEKLLPPDLEARTKNAVKRFWSGRLDTAVASQEGGRGSVIRGNNLDGFADIIKHICLHCGLSEDHVIISGRTRLTVPGYFRPTKMWDSLIIYKGRLVAAFEFKSQVGPSFGNNFNNRSEESIGSASDFWIAHRENAFSFLGESGNAHNIKPPFLGFLMLLEDCEASKRSVRVDDANFKPFPEFVDSSYARRYELLIERMVAEKLYSSGCLILTDREAGARSGNYLCPNDLLSPLSLFADLAGTLFAAKETYSN